MGRRDGDLDRKPACLAQLVEWCAHVLTRCALFMAAFEHRDDVGVARDVCDVTWAGCALGLRRAALRAARRAHRRVDPVIYRATAR